MKKLKIKIRTFYSILFNKHWVFIHISEKDIRKFLSGEDASVGITYCGLQRYTHRAIIKQVAESIDSDELILDKAAFEAEAEFRVTQKKK